MGTQTPAPPSPGVSATIRVTHGHTPRPHVRETILFVRRMRKPLYAGLKGVAAAADDKSVSALGAGRPGKAAPPGALASMPAQDERQGCCAFFQGACSRTAPRTPALSSGASRSIPVSRRDLPRHRRPVIGRRCEALQTLTPTARNGAAGRAMGVTRPAPHACHEKRHEQGRFFVGPERKPLIGTCLTPRGRGQ